MKTYMVWIEVEEYDEETDEYQNVDVLDFPSTGEFETEDGAVTFANDLHCHGLEMLENEDH